MSDRTAVEHPPDRHTNKKKRNRLELSDRRTHCTAGDFDIMHRFHGCGNRFTSDRVGSHCVSRFNRIKHSLQSTLSTQAPAPDQRTPLCTIGLLLYATQHGVNKSCVCMCMCVSGSSLFFFVPLSCTAQAANKYYVCNIMGEQRRSLLAPHKITHDRFYDNYAAAATTPGATNLWHRSATGTTQRPKNSASVRTRASRVLTK